LTNAPCGCDQLRAADAEARKGNDASAKALREDGAEQQARWGCPFRKGGREPREGDLPPGDAERAALRAVESLTGTAGLATCPLWYAKQPCVARVVALRQWRDKGQLQLRVRHPSPALCDAIDAIDAGVNGREADDARRLSDRAKTPPKSDPSEP
jgi:hypothetical protein